MEKRKPKKRVDLYGKHYSSNALRLSMKEMIVGLIIFTICVFVILPFSWRVFEKLEFGKDFRLAEKYRDNYWIYQKWANEAAKKYPVIFLGDSVVWGMYVNNENTLPAKLNKLIGKQAVANLAIDGLHSVAMVGILENYAKCIKNKAVILHCNPLWMNSRDYDLSGEKPTRIHHPRLIPQFIDKPTSYDEDLTARMDAVKEKKIAFFRLLNHIRLAFFDNEDFREWMVENPYANPLNELKKKLEVLEMKKTANSNDNWSKMGIPLQDWDWVPMEKSRQWKAFLWILERLNRNDNKVLVMIGPINPYILTKESLAKYRKLQGEIKCFLAEKNIDCIIVPDMPSETYADASHPLEKGYQIIAEELYKTSFMKEIQSL